MTELVPDNRKRFDFPAFSVLLVHSHGFSRRMFGGLVRCWRRTWGPTMIMAQPRIVRRVTIEVPISIGVNDKRAEIGQLFLYRMNGRLWPRLTTFALQQVVSFLGYSGHSANVATKAAHDPNRTSQA
jgi:hypothetical protein